MISTTSSLPDDPERLKQIIAEYESEIGLLREQVAHLYSQIFGPKSEKLPRSESPQLPLFDLPEPDPETTDDPEDEVAVAGHTRKKKGRQPLPESLPRIEKVHDLKEEEKVCHCGAQLSRIGEEVSEKLDIIPAVIQVIRHVRPKYSCKQCENVDEKGTSVKIAPVPKQLLPKSIASGGLAAHILTGKFVDALPFYRQEKQFTRLGADIPRATMCRWAMRIAEAVMPLKELLRQEILSGPLINADETTVQVLHEPGKTPQSKSYMWVFRGGGPGAPSLYFHYHQSRQGDVAASFLRRYKGVVQTDGYKGYDFLDHKKEILHIGCWAHARRKFMEARKARGKNNKKFGSDDKALKFIKDLYRVEQRVKQKKLSAQELQELRFKEAKPILEKMHKWLVAKARQVVPKSLLGKAMQYCLNQWDRLVGYVELPEATPDNNLAENAIRPFCVGRRNWLFAGTPEGAQASATIYSLIESAKASKLEPYKYLRYLFENLPFAQSEEDYKKLMPRNLTSEELDTVSKVSLV
jgi:transposase